MSDFNPEKKKKVQSCILTCKDCQAFESAEYPEGVCILNPPQLVVENGEMYSAFPNVDGEVHRCMKLIKKGG